MLPQSLSVYVHVSHHPGSQLRLKPKRPCSDKLKRSGGNIDWQWISSCITRPTSCIGHCVVRRKRRSSKQKSRKAQVTSPSIQWQTSSCLSINPVYYHHIRIVRAFLSHSPPFSVTRYSELEDCVESRRWATWRSHTCSLSPYGHFNASDKAWDAQDHQPINLKTLFTRSNTYLFPQKKFGHTSASHMLNCQSLPSNFSRATGLQKRHSNTSD